MNGKTIRKIMVLILSAVPLMLLCGCGANSSFRRSRALSYMKKTYGIKFEYDENKEGSGVFGTNNAYCDFYATCEEYPGERVRIVSYDGMHFGTDFPMVLYKDKTEESMISAAEGIYGGDEIRVLFDEENNRISENGKMTEDEFLKSGDIGRLGICTDDNKDPEGDYEKLIAALQEKGVNCKPIVYHFTDDSYVGDGVNIHTSDVDKRYGAVMLEGIKGILDDGFDGAYRFKKGFG